MVPDTQRRAQDFTRHSRFLAHCDEAHRCARKEAMMASSDNWSKLEQKMSEATSQHRSCRVSPSHEQCHQQDVRRGSHTARGRSKLQGQQRMLGERNAVLQRRLRMAGTFIPSCIPREEHCASVSRLSRHKRPISARTARPPGFCSSADQSAPPAWQASFPKETQDEFEWPLESSTLETTFSRPKSADSCAMPSSVSANAIITAASEEEPPRTAANSKASKEARRPRSASSKLPGDKSLQSYIAHLEEEIELIDGFLKQALPPKQRAALCKRRWEIDAWKSTVSSELDPVNQQQDSPSTCLEPTTPAAWGAAVSVEDGAAACCAAMQESKLEDAAASPTSPLPSTTAKCILQDAASSPTISLPSTTAPSSRGPSTPATASPLLPRQQPYPRAADSQQRRADLVDAVEDRC